MKRERRKKEQRIERKGGLGRCRECGNQEKKKSRHPKTLRLPLLPQVVSRTPLCPEDLERRKKKSVSPKKRKRETYTRKKENNQKQAAHCFSPSYKTTHQLSPFEIRSIQRLRTDFFVFCVWCVDAGSRQNNTASKLRQLTFWISQMRNAIGWIPKRDPRHELRLLILKLWPEGE
ncbi:hypothetical protein M438DRAFT_126124 [Aureobasidium pullulans EXF-150]|uniref:Uncharacterized protein n=1 Tax=Aureobasidium pullulans EXF-150 TaxID=1043002 RepID=A0A074XV52_AURPU|nr:uncharacterized protein M438DRAFT_126124 [Aureobasidium pullulans EXF-150]KEQ87499.1 hypothetical protein M438DRAFT_126124 [Aureobasidium pullulans EXF-150]